MNNAQRLQNGFTPAQLIALETLKVNGSTTKATPAIRALVRKGLVLERKRFQAPSVFTLAPAPATSFVDALKAARAAIAKAIGTDK